MPDTLTLILLALATWRITSLIVNEDGLFSVFTRLRALASHTPLRDGIHCVWCMSVWVGALLATLYVVALPAWALMARDALVLLCALSALAIVLQIVIERLQD